MKPSIENYFEMLYAPIHFPVEVVNQNGQLIYVNPAFTFLWGFTLDELKEYSILADPTLKGLGIKGILKNITENNKPLFIENYSDSLLKGRDITMPVIRTKIFMINIERELFYILFHEDQTELFLTEAEIRKARDGNKEAERLKNTFLNVLSHELRTPLNIILGYSSIIKETLKDKISSEDRVYLDNLYSGSERLFKSITQMLEFAQLEAGNYNLKLETIDFITCLNGILNQIKSSSDEKNIDIVKNIKNDSIMVEGDLYCVENALLNLLNNAVKFTNKGFIEIEVAVIEDRDLAICKIKDSGVGISSEYMEHLFRPFSQEDLNIGRNYEGNGLGLALAKRFIEKLGGSLLVDSIKGVGTTFSLTLPLAEKKKGNITSPEFEKKMVLMLDDSNESYSLLNAFLKQTHRIEMHTFRDFNLNLLTDSKYEFILFDVNQTKWDQSLIICKDIKKHDKFNRPLIILSSEFMEERIKMFYAAGADKFIVKPFSKIQLLEILSNVP
jgi:signal transduction histidine kinase/CheY-like chemotaxis protein